MLQYKDEDIEIKRLSDKYSHDISSFYCNDTELEDFIKTEAIDFQQNLLGVTHLFYIKQQLVGFVTLSTDIVYKQSLPKKEMPSISHKTYPALLIGRLAIQEEWKHKYIGTKICIWVQGLVLKAHKYAGCKFLKVDSKPDAIDFYKKCQFIELKNEASETITLMKPIKPKQLIS